MGLEKLKGPLLKTARKIILEEGDIYPMVFYTLKQEIVGMAPLAVEFGPLEPPGRFKTRVAMRLLGFATRIKGIEYTKDFDAILLLSTAWSASAKTEEEKRELKRWVSEGKLLSDYPGKFETLILSYSEGLGKNSAEAIPFFRTPDGPVFEAPLGKPDRMESPVLDNFWRGYNLELTGL